jgi:hypothetical protein
MHSPYITIKVAISNHVSVNLKLRSGETVSILPLKIEENDFSWHVEDVFGDVHCGFDIEDAKIGFIKMGYEK